MKKRAICGYCKKEFTFNEWPSNKGKVGKYCSKKCRIEGHYRHMAKLLRKPRVIKECPQCGKRYKSPKWQNRKYCSRRCSAASRHGKCTVTKACPICGTEFTRARSFKQIYCSKPCQTKGLRPYWNSLGQKAKKHP